MKSDRTGVRKPPAPRRSSSPARAGLKEVRRLCLTLPEVAEVEAWGDPTFRVRDKIFCMHKIGDGRSSIWCKAPPGMQELLVASRPASYFVPPYVGHRGWVGIRLDVKVEWRTVERLVRRSYTLTAPKKLASAVEVDE